MGTCIFVPATWKSFLLYSSMICSKGDFHVAKYSIIPDSNKISNKTFQLSFISRYHCVIMYACSNVERIGLGSNMTPHTHI